MSHRPDKTRKKFDAVAMMRRIRAKLSEKYIDHPSAEAEDLARIRQKYGFSIKQKA